MLEQRVRRRGSLPDHAAILLTVSLFLPGVAWAQPPRSPFDSIAATLRVTANVNENVFHRYWKSDPGVELELETPFYLGLAQAGFHFNSFDGKREEQPDFASIYAFVGWGYEWPIYGRLGWQSGLRVGTFVTRFSGSGDNRSEMELAAALDTRLGYRLTHHWSVDLSTRYQVVFTHERLRLVFLAFGTSYSLKTPTWLQEFFE